jgi:hypothetical protein
LRPVFFEKQGSEVSDGQGGSVGEAVVAGTEEINFWVMGWEDHARVLEQNPFLEASGRRPKGS